MSARLNGLKENAILQQLSECELQSFKMHHIPSFAKNLLDPIPIEAVHCVVSKISFRTVSASSNA